MRQTLCFYSKRLLLEDRVFVSFRVQTAIIRAKSDQIRKRHTMDIANLDTAAVDTVVKFLRTMKKAEADFTGPMQSVAQRRNLVAFLKAGCPKIDFDKGSVVQITLPEGEALARLILGDDLITPEDIESATGIRYTDEQKAHATETMPDLEMLQAIKADGMMLVFGPPKDLNLLKVRDLDKQMFDLKKDGWYAQSEHSFSRTDKVRGGQWLIIRKTPVDRSTSKNWSEQSAMIKLGDRVPNAAEMSYALLIYQKVRDVYLLANVVVRTSSVDAYGYHVDVGGFRSPGTLLVNSWDSSSRVSLLGVASARE